MPRRRDPNIPHNDELAWSFGQRVAALRRRAGIEIKDLAARSGMSANYIWRLEQGLVVPNLRNIARLALSLDIPIPLMFEKVDISSVRLENRVYTRRQHLDDTSE